MKPINEEKIKFILNLKRKGIRDKEVLKAMETIDRKIFLDGIFKSRSEDDIPLTNKLWSNYKPAICCSKDD